MYRDLARSLRKNMTDSERWLWAELRNRRFSGFRFRRQMPIGPYIADFACLNPRFIIELDGGHHAGQQTSDAERTLFLESQGFYVVRFWNDEIMRDWETISDWLWEVMSYPPPGLTATLPHKGGGKRTEGA